MLLCWSPRRALQCLYVKLLLTSAALQLNKSLLCTVV